MRPKNTSRVIFQLVLFQAALPFLVIIRNRFVFESNLKR
jgi:hypothetical protein